MIRAIETPLTDSWSSFGVGRWERVGFYHTLVCSKGSEKAFPKWDPGLFSALAVDK